MIRLHRPGIPAALKARQASATRTLQKAWLAGEVLEFDAGIYAHPDVKNALRAAQHNKCAYCETINPTSHDVVEHYRPKNGWRQKRREKLTKPQYFWLAYAWENLLFVCDRCNDGGHKQNLFPLANPSKRATANVPDTSREKPLLLDPYTDAPGEHIEWNRDIPRGRRKSRRGRATIDVCGLDKDGLLMDQRRGYLFEMEKVVALIECFQRDAPERRAVHAVLLSKLEDSAPWAAMIRASLGERIALL